MVAAQSINNYYWTRSFPM